MPQQDAGYQAAQEGRQQFRRALYQQSLQAIDVTVYAGDDASGLGAIKIRNTQCLHMCKHTYPQIIQH
ncbi:hypothetical protein D3C81_2144930 [compost metagenome]